MMKAVGYFKEAARADRTLAQQNKAFLEFCSRNGHEPAGTFADGSSSNGAAPGFRELLSFLRRSEQGMLVVMADVSVLGTQVRDTARRYFQLEGLGATVTLMDSAAAPDEFLTQWSSNDAGNTLGDRVRAAMRRKAVKGEVLGHPPYGYKVGGRRRLELVPEEAVVVRYIFRLYLQEGLGIRLIARRLNEEGLKTRRGGNWSMVSIRDILRNRSYLGTYARFGVRVPGSHPALVSSDDFNRAQDRLNSRRTSYAPRVTSEFLLSGIARCGSCGNKLIGVTRKQAWTRQSGERMENSYRYYQCESRTNQSVCSYHTRRAEQLEDEVRRLLPDVRCTASDANETQREGNSEALDKLHARLKAADRHIERYVRDAALGRISREQMRTLGLGAAGNRLAIEDEIEVLQRRATSAHPAGDVLRRLSEEWDSLTFAERQARLRGSVERIVVNDEAVEIVPAG
jgi:DNA invertase Pin-like site-specific DNA recombinase